MNVTHVYFHVFFDSFALHTSELNAGFSVGMDYLGSFMRVIFRLAFLGPIHFILRS